MGGGNDPQASRDDVIRLERMFSSLQEEQRLMLSSKGWRRSNRRLTAGESHGPGEVHESGSHPEVDLVDTCGTETSQNICGTEEDRKAGDKPPYAIQIDVSRVNQGPGSAAPRSIYQPATQQGQAAASGALESFLGDTVLMASPVKGSDSGTSGAKKLHLPVTSWQRLCAGQRQNPLPGAMSRKEARASAIPKPVNPNAAMRPLPLPAHSAVAGGGVDGAGDPGSPADGRLEKFDTQIQLPFTAPASTDAPTCSTTTVRADAEVPPRGSNCPSENKQGCTMQPMSRDGGGLCKVGAEQTCNPFTPGPRIARSPPAVVRMTASARIHTAPETREIPVGTPKTDMEPSGSMAEERVSPGHDLGALECAKGLDPASQEPPVTADVVAQQASVLHTPLVGRMAPAAPSSSTPWPLISPWRAPWLLGSPLPHGLLPGSKRCESLSSHPVDLSSNSEQESPELMSTQPRCASRLAFASGPIPWTDISQGSPQDPSQGNPLLTPRAPDPHYGAAPALDTCQSPPAAPMCVSDAGHFLSRAPSLSAEVTISIDAMAISSPDKVWNAELVSRLSDSGPCQTQLRQSQSWQEEDAIEGHLLPAPAKDRAEGHDLRSASVQQGQPTDECIIARVADLRGEDGLMWTGHAVDSSKPSATTPSAQGRAQDSSASLIPEVVGSSNSSPSSDIQPESEFQGNALQGAEQEGQGHIAAPTGLVGDVTMVIAKLDRFPSLPGTSLLIESGDFSSMTLVELQSTASIRDPPSMGNSDPDSTGLGSLAFAHPTSCASAYACMSHDHETDDQMGEKLPLDVLTEESPVAEAQHAVRAEAATVVPSPGNDPAALHDDELCASSPWEDTASDHYPACTRPPGGQDGDVGDLQPQSIPEEAPGMSQWSPSPPDVFPGGTSSEPLCPELEDLVDLNDSLPLGHTPGNNGQRLVDDQGSAECPAGNPSLVSQPSPQGPVTETGTANACGDHVPSRGCFQACSPKKVSPSPQRSLLATLRQAFGGRQSPGISPLRTTLPRVSCQTPGLAVLTTPPSPCPAFAVRRTSSISFPTPLPDDETTDPGQTISVQVPTGPDPSTACLPECALGPSLSLGPNPSEVLEPLALSVTSLPGHPSPSDSSCCMTEGCYSPSWEEEASDGSDGGRIILGPLWESWRCRARDEVSCPQSEKDGRPATAPFLGPLAHGNAADKAMPRRGSQEGTALQRLAERRRRQHQSTLSSVRSSLQSGSFVAAGSSTRFSSPDADWVAVSSAPPTARPLEAAHPDVNRVGALERSAKAFVSSPSGRHGESSPSKIRAWPADGQWGSPQARPRTTPHAQPPTAATSTSARPATCGSPAQRSSLGSSRRDQENGEDVGGTRASRSFLRRQTYNLPVIPKLDWSSVRARTVTRLEREYIPDPQRGPAALQEKAVVSSGLQDPGHRSVPAAQAPREVGSRQSAKKMPQANARAGTVGSRSSYTIRGGSPSKAGRHSGQPRPAHEDKEGPLDDILGQVTELLSQVNNILGSN